MVDASFVSVPKQRNTPDENKRIKAGEGDGHGVEVETHDEVGLGNRRRTSGIVVLAAHYAVGTRQPVEVKGHTVG